MRNLFYLIIFFVIISCSNNKIGYWCGDHPCINKKEKEAYFKKTMIVEMKALKKGSFKNNSEIEKIMQQAHIDEKKRILNEKDLAKQVKLEEKRRIQEEKDLTKQTKQDKKKIFKKKNETSKQNVIINTVSKNTAIDSTKFNELVEKINKNNTFRPYPDINDIPN